MTWLLAQQSEPPPLTPEQIEEIHRQLTPWWLVFGLTGLWIFGLLYSLFTLWMIWYCVRYDSERGTWLWILLMFQGVGPLLYFLARWLPSSSFEPPAFIKRFRDGPKLRRLEVAARQIGNPHQYIEWGEALRDVKDWPQARVAYNHALNREPANLMALWGAAQVESQLGDPHSARSHLEKVLAIEPGYKFGDVSLLYGRTLRQLNDIETEIAHWRLHLKKWRHAEAMYWLAERLADRNEVAEARQLVQTMIADIEVCPRAVARKSFFWKGRGKRLLRRLPT